MVENYLLEMENIDKTFGTTKALDGVNLQIKRGEIHGLLGGNGAGKTTLMNVLYGLYKNDSGTIKINGEAVRILSPKNAIDHGIGMVHQQFLQVTNFTVAENIVIGTKPKSYPLMNLDDEMTTILALADRFGLPVTPAATISDLPLGVRQRVEIIKALYRGVKILVLDEPTTNLTPQEVDALFSSLRLMVNEGLSVIFITHKLREVLEVCDRISVLRHGKNVLTMDRADASEEAFVKAMVGEDLNVENSILYADQGLNEKLSNIGEETVLEVKNLTVGLDEVPVVKDVSFSLRKGEILGVAGISGNGQLELLEAILGLRDIKEGKISLAGEDITNLETHKLLQRSISYVPEDRWQDGLLSLATVEQNLILGLHRQEPYSDGRLLKRGSITEKAKSLIDAFNIKTEGPHDTAGNLSGGNIQRLLLARSFSQAVDLILLHNPTRGLDIPSIEFIYSLILERKDLGMATLLVSENLDELFLMSNHLIVFCNGEIMGRLKRSEFDKYAVGSMMSGIRQGEE